MISNELQLLFLWLLIFKTFIILHNEHVRAQEFEQVEPLIWETAKYM